VSQFYKHFRRKQLSLALLAKLVKHPQNKYEPLSNFLQKIFFVCFALGCIIIIFYLLESVAGLTR
jgi:hypothetical protein